MPMRGSELLCCPQKCEYVQSRMAAGQLQPWCTTLAALCSAPLACRQSGDVLHGVTRQQCWLTYLKYSTSIRDMGLLQLLYGCTVSLPNIVLPSLRSSLFPEQVASGDRPLLLDCCTTAHALL